MFSRPRSIARFLVSYAIGSHSYCITIPGQSAASVRQNWQRPGSRLLSVVECDSNGLPV